LAIQRRAGLDGQAAHAVRAIRDHIPPPAEAFLAEQPMIVTGGTDHAGRIWASHLTGPPGFLRVPAPDVLAIDAVVPRTDPLAELLDAPARIGLIAIEPATRRRMRVNGTASPADGGLRVVTDQVIANCPKYIQKRTRHEAPATPRGAESVARVVRGHAPTPAQQDALRAADTFFVATASERGDADASHRGGNPGFVRVLSATELRWPDYVGNSMFLTLGNLDVNPAAGLFVPDWRTGTTLHLSGTARVSWDADEIARVPGARRLVDFTVTDVWEIHDPAAVRWDEPEYSRFNPPVEA